MFHDFSGLTFSSSAGSALSALGEKKASFPSPSQLHAALTGLAVSNAAAKAAGGLKSPAPEIEEPLDVSAPVALDEGSPSTPQAHPSPQGRTQSADLDHPLVKGSTPEGSPIRPAVGSVAARKAQYEAHIAEAAAAPSFWGLFRQPRAVAAVPAPAPAPEAAAAVATAGVPAEPLREKIKPQGAGFFALFTGAGRNNSIPIPKPLTPAVSGEVPEAVRSASADAEAEGSNSGYAALEESDRAASAAARMAALSALLAPEDLSGDDEPAEAPAGVDADADVDVDAPVAGATAADAAAAADLEAGESTEVPEKEEREVSVEALVEGKEAVAAVEKSDLAEVDEGVQALAAAEQGEPSGKAAVGAALAGKKEAVAAGTADAVPETSVEPEAPKSVHVENTARPLMAGAAVAAAAAAVAVPTAVVVSRGSAAGPSGRSPV